MTLHDIYQGKKQHDAYCQEMKMVMHFNTWNQSVAIPDQVEHTHHVTIDYSIPDNDIEWAIINKIQFLYATLKEMLEHRPSELISTSIWGSQ
jgi:hypothetical protein